MAKKEPTFSLADMGRIKSLSNTGMGALESHYDKAGVEKLMEAIAVGAFALYCSLIVSQAKEDDNEDVSEVLETTDRLMRDAKNIIEVAQISAVMCLGYCIEEEIR